MTVESLKRDARRHEQREEWVKALDLYLQAIEHQEQEDEPDIALHNRVGDIQVRVGDLEGAMANYERAIDLYVAAELPNNAIAICRKIVRHDPERPATYLRMGQIRASQGFTVDARQNFITYAEMMQAKGESDEALRSLQELVALAPEDVDSRTFVAELLAARGESDEALAYLVDAYRVSEAQGLDESQAILVRIREIDPAHPVPTIDEPSAERSEEEARMDEVFEGYGVATDESEADAEAGPVAETDDLVLETGSADDSPGIEWASGDLTSNEIESGREDSDEAEDARLGGTSGIDESWLLGDEESETAGSEAAEGEDREEPGWDDSIAWEGAEDGANGAGTVIDTALELDTGPGGQRDDEPVGGRSLDEGPHEPEPLEAERSMANGLDGLGDWDEGASDAAVDAGALGEEEGPSDGEGAFDLSGLGLEDEEAADDLPYLHFDPDSLDVEKVVSGDGGPEEDSVPEPPAETGDGVRDLRERVGRVPDDADGWRRLGDALFQEGDTEGGRDALETAHRLYAERGEPEKGVRVIRELLIHEPHRIELRQRAVEYAHRSNERTLLVEAFLELADGLRAAGEDEKASAVLQQVLEIDPGNLRANEGVAAAPSEPSASTSSAAADAPASDYVDLGAMVLDEEGERTTRWTVPAEEPTGDEEADFAKMLSQFKEKVAENISSDDAQSHYDLGAAYKDMGLMLEAVGEFQQALRAQPNHLATFEMLGECFLEMGDADVAIRTLERGLTLGTEVEDDLLGIYYWLAKANEGVGKSEAAREYYERIFSLDINFKDVVERLKALR